MPVKMSEPTPLLLLLLALVGLAGALATAVLATLAAHAQHEIAHHDARAALRRREIERQRQQRETEVG